MLAAQRTPGLETSPFGLSLDRFEARYRRQATAKSLESIDEALGPGDGIAVPAACKLSLIHI